MPEATVIVPTHEHATTLPHAVRSALRQTVADIELVIIGDGATEDTRAAAEALAASDPRVRFEAHPKSPGHGFLYRHEAVCQANAEAVFYLSDDDLWYPEHIEVVTELLRSAEFAVALTISVSLDGPRIKSPDRPDHAALSGQAARTGRNRPVVGHGPHARGVPARAARLAGHRPRAQRLLARVRDHTWPAARERPATHGAPVHEPPEGGHVS